jgi:hypothetical protein
VARRFDQFIDSLVQRLVLCRGRRRKHRRDGQRQSNDTAKRPEHREPQAAGNERRDPCMGVDG